MDNLENNRITENSSMNMAKIYMPLTYHKKYLYYDNNKLLQTSDHQKSDVQIYVVQDKAAICIVSLNEFVHAINNDHTLIHSKSIYFFNLINEKDYSLINTSNNYLSAGGGNEGWAVYFSKNHSLWEHFWLSYTGDLDITPLLFKKIISIDEDYNREISHLANKINKIEKSFRSVRSYFIKNAPCECFRPELESFYQYMTGKPLDLINPKTYNEKIQHIKLFGDMEKMSRLADKIAVREFVTGMGYESILVPVYGIYDRPEEIDWDNLPNSFVIKCNHGCQMNVVVNDKKDINIAEITTKLNSWLAIDYEAASFEMQYRPIRHRLLIEKNLAVDGISPTDFKLFCFSGIPAFITCITGRYTQKTCTATYDAKWNKLHFSWVFPPFPGDLPRPVNLDKMIAIASKLSAGFPHVRVDLYHLDDGSIYFGEMTFSPSSGFGHWSDPRIDALMGEIFDLNSGTRPVSPHLADPHACALYINSISELCKTRE